jgi:hypothetical protein
MKLWFPKGLNKPQNYFKVINNVIKLILQTCLTKNTENLNFRLVPINRKQNKKIKLNKTHMILLSTTCEIKLGKTKLCENQCYEPQPYNDYSGIPNFRFSRLGLNPMSHRNT